MVAYKCFWQSEKNLHSFNMSGGKHTIYKEGQENFPHLKDSRIFVFDTLKNANNFCDNRFATPIWKVEAKNPRKIKQIASLITDIDMFWKLKKKHKKLTLSTTPAPIGAYTCESVVLIEKIKI